MRKKIEVFDVVNVVLMIGLMAVTLYPFWYMMVVSVSGEFHVLRNDVLLWPKGFTMEWYKIVLEDKKVITGYRNTVFYTVLGTFIALVVTSMGAFALSQKRMPLRKPLMLAIVFTILFGGGMIPSYLVAREIGILDTIWAMVLPGAVSTFNLLVFRAFFEGLPEELYEAGRMDGLNDIGLFARIVVPLSSPVYAAIGLFVAVGLWNEFYRAILYIRNPDLYPLMMVLQNLIVRGAQASQMASQASSGGDLVVSNALRFATIIFATLPILVLYPFLQKYFVKGVLLGSVKG
ncbi:carbohydrate ABC transporter permease [Paenibacillus koleovorans]|uniref:carbohydrate ABC transporter permease n=1 Tax=Paenibacillus koleovorans TaxID=121608 RepID=UPI000FDBDB82|nr:carbohydrate ABC transporter permease [Paenibacillus koleovorans]